MKVARLHHLTQVASTFGWRSRDALEGTGHDGVASRPTSTPAATLADRTPMVGRRRLTQRSHRTLSRRRWRFAKVAAAAALRPDPENGIKDTVDAHHLKLILLARSSAHRTSRRSRADSFRFGTLPREITMFGEVQPRKVERKFPAATRSFSLYFHFICVCFHRGIVNVFSDRSTNSTVPDIPSDSETGMANILIVGIHTEIGR